MQSKPDLRAALMAVTTLFFAWGFITSMIDPLIASVRTIFSLSYTQSMLTQFAFFFAYGVVSLPGAALVGRLGYGRSVIYALLAMLVGCLIVPIATKVDHYELVLLALFVIASGITVLQVAANPLAAALGPPRAFALAADTLTGVQLPRNRHRAVSRGDAHVEGRHV
jgi:FHS family L-fucose permease-like MFS transporter